MSGTILATMDLKIEARVAPLLLKDEAVSGTILATMDLKIEARVASSEAPML